MAEHIQRKTDENTANIPVWHGEPSKDDFTLSAFVDKLDTAKDLLTLNEVTTFRYFQQALRGSAAAWLETWLTENRDLDRTWANVKPPFRKAFGDVTTAATFIKDSTAVNLATFGGDFNKFYSHIVKMCNLHCEPFIARRIVLPDDHGLNNAQQDLVGRLVTNAYNDVHDQLMLDIFLNGLPKAMYDKVATKHTLTKVSQVIEYLKECDENARRNAISATQVSDEQFSANLASYRRHIEPLEDLFDAAAAYTANGRNSFNNFRGRFNNTNRGRGNATASNRGGQTNNGGGNRGQSSGYRGQNNRGQNSSNRGNANNSNGGNSSIRKPLICIYCRKTGHDQEKCFERIKDNQPCLTSKGVQYYPQKVAATAANQPKQPEDQQPTDTYSVFLIEV